MEQTATNPQTGEKIVFRNGQWQPLNGGSAPRQGPISSGTKPRDPLEDASKQQALANSQQALVNATLEEEIKTIKAKGDKARFDATGGVDGTEGENKAAALTTNLQAAMNNIRAVTKADPGAAKPSWLEIGVGVFGQDAKELAQTEKRRDVTGSQFIAIDSALTLATGAAYTPSQLEGYTRSLFPTVSDTPYNIAQKRRKFEEVIQAGRLQAGAKAPNIEQAIAAVNAIYGPADGTNSPAMTGDVPTGTDVEIGLNSSDGDQPYNRNNFLKQRGLDPNKEATMVAFWNSNRDNEGLTPAGALRFYAENNIPPPSDADLNKMIEQAKQGLQFGPVDTSADEAAYRAELEQQTARMGDAGYTEMADQGLLSGLSDEFVGVGGAISSLVRGDDPRLGYQFSRDVMRLQNQKADANTGVLGDVVELGAGLAVPLGAANTVGRAAKVGAIAGGVGGFGYGEGAGGSALNALIGAGAGTALGAGGAKLGNALTARSAARAEAAPARNALLQAAADEGTTVNRAMVDPSLQSRVTGVSGTMAGSRKIEKEMGAISDQIEGRVANLGGNGDVLTGEVGGGKIRAIAARQIEKSGKAAKRIYDNAAKVAGNTKVAPKESLEQVDKIIKVVAETSETNADELVYLQKLKADLSKDLSVGGLRRLRTKLRKSISKGDLIFGESEADVLAIMDAASNDIANGLTAQGKQGAAKLFKEADNLYRERAQYIEGTLQKLIGKRNSTMSDQQVFAKFRSLADPKGDGPAMSKFMSELEPDEVADIAATFAADLGRNAKGEFSTAFLATQAEKLGKNPTALTAIFGEEGAKSVKNLIILSKEHARVTNAARGSQTGIRADYRSWLTNALFTGGAGIMTAASQGAGTGAVVGAVTAATVGGAKLAKDAFSARALMSPKVTGWLRSAPRTAEPKAIDKHFKKLAAIAKAEPAIANDIRSIQDFIFQAANDNTNRAVAQDGESEGGR